MRFGENCSVIAQIYPGEEAQSFLKKACIFQRGEWEKSCNRQSSAFSLGKPSLRHSCLAKLYYSFQQKVVFGFGEKI